MKTATKSAKRSPKRKIAVRPVSNAETKPKEKKGIYIRAHGRKRDVELSKEVWNRILPQDQAKLNAAFNILFRTGIVCSITEYFDLRGEDRYWVNLPEELKIISLATESLWSTPEIEAIMEEAKKIVRPLTEIIEEIEERVIRQVHHLGIPWNCAADRVTDMCHNEKEA